MTTLADYESLVSEVAPGCSQATYRSKIYEMFRLFCSQTETNQNDEVEISVVSGTQEYTLTAPTGYSIINCLSVLDEDDDTFTDWSWDKMRQIFRLDNEPGSDDTLTATVSLLPISMPTQDITVPDNIDLRYREGIVAGCKAALLAMAVQPWSNLTLAGEYYRMFNDTVSRARIEALTTYKNRAYREKSWV